MCTKIITFSLPIMKVLIRTSKSQCEKSIISGHPVANQASDLWYPISGMPVSLLRNIHLLIDC